MIQHPGNPLKSQADLSLETCPFFGFFGTITVGTNSLNALITGTALELG